MLSQQMWQFNPNSHHEDTKVTKNTKKGKYKGGVNGGRFSGNARIGRRSEFYRLPTFICSSIFFDFLRDLRVFVMRSSFLVDASSKPWRERYGSLSVWIP